MVTQWSFRECRLEEAASLLSLWRKAEATVGVTDTVEDIQRVISHSAAIVLVAEQAGQPVGHILFSPVTLTGQVDLALMGLAPMAVVPEQQNTGIGSALVEAGLEACRDKGICAVVVLGHPSYYPRFGFAPASGYDIDSDYDVPDEIFMALELETGALANRAGRICYHPVFESL